MNQSINCRKVIHTQMKEVNFSLYSEDEIKSISVVEIITPLSFNSLGHPLPGGLYDLAMGPFDGKGTCSTCQQQILNCPGHFGHIELPLPVLNPMFSKTLLQILRMSCLECHQFLIPKAVKNLIVTQLTLLQNGLLKEAYEAETILSEIFAVQDAVKKLQMTKKEAKGRTRSFETFLNDSLKNKNIQLKDGITHGIEAFRLGVIKKAFSFAKTSQKCSNCGSICKKMMLFESKLLYSKAPSETIEEESNEDEETEKIQSINQKYLTALEARDHLRKLWDIDKKFLSCIFPVFVRKNMEYPTDLLFITTVSVTPPKNRPAQMISNEIIEHPQNTALKHVATSSSLMKYTLQAIKEGDSSVPDELKQVLGSLKGDSLRDKLEEVWKELQEDVDRLLDREKSVQASINKNQIFGLKQIIERKEGLFRMHMMGKRVNYAARTVITPDPNIHVEEVGIPDVFAKCLTFPTPVTPWNVAKLRKLVINGPNIHPGAVAVENEFGQISRLNPKDISQRKGFASRLLVADQAGARSFRGIKKVYRHLQNGDPLLLNRQPSLHRPSIMAHKARILYGDKVFRLHYANCKHYNADFDGDEMNAHFPQNHVASSEAYNLVNVCNHFLVPKDGTPLGGLIQDHVVAAVKMTMRGRFFSRDDYHELLIFALGSYSKSIITEPPSIIKPQMLWSGKQVVTSIILNLVPAGKAPPTLTSSAKIKHNEWIQEESRHCKIGKDSDPSLMSESTVIIRHGRLLCGILDKVHLGATPYGLCHTFYELYGSGAVGNLLTAFARLMTNFLQWEGFTLGVRDVLVKPKADDMRRGFIAEVAEVGSVAGAIGVGIQVDAPVERLKEKLEVVHRACDTKARAILDQAYKRKLDEYTNKINRSCLPHGLVEVFPSNNLQLLVQSGAKGSTVNTMQMSCLLGQIELEGKRPSLMLSGKSLPSFKQYDPSPRAGGFISGRFLTGIRPQEFFFHCMAGREGLIDTAVKTSRSGYLQRCLVKLLEGVVTQYDGTVRDSDGSIIQFLYGEDGIDVSKGQFLKEKALDFLSNNFDSIVDSNVKKLVVGLGDQKQLEEEKRKVSEWIEMNGEPFKQGRLSPSLEFFKEMGQTKHFKNIQGFNTFVGRSNKTLALIKEWRKLKPSSRARYEKFGARCPDPVISNLRPDSYYGSISESLEKNLDRYFLTKGQETRVQRKTNLRLKKALYSKAMKSVSYPGDAVGVLAGQSIGEPSTQMTLNTFHFAGRGEMNMTLGIPRLREILMVASGNIKTPSMEIPFHPHVTSEEAEALRLRLTKVTLSQVLQRVDVIETLNPEQGTRHFTLTFIFLEGSEYCRKFSVKPANVLRYFEKFFLRYRLLSAIRRLTKMKRATLINEKEVGTDRWKVKDVNLGEEYEEEDVAGENLYEEAQKRGSGEDHQSSDEEPEADDVDATQSKRKTRQLEAEYDEPEEDERLQEIEDGEDEENTRNPDEEEDADELDLDREIRGEGYESRIASVLAIDVFIESYKFDRLKEEQCTLVLRVPIVGERINIGSVLKKEAGRGVIRQVRDINRAFIIGGGKNPLLLKTEGINLLAMSNFNHLVNLNKLHCNNIVLMAECYGIEAASRVIVKEMRNVFKAYGIELDNRHLTLISEYMTSSGVYRAFNRFGIEGSSSPFHQMSFETCVGFLRDATLAGRSDKLTNPSASIVVGKPTQVGTGIFNLLQRN